MHISEFIQDFRERAKKKLESISPLEGNNKWVDHLIFDSFDKINEFGKELSTENFKNRVYQRLMDYLLETMPSYDSAQPLMGSKAEEQLFLAYKTSRFLEAAEPGDVILVRGNQRISRIIQTLTTSPYSHAAYYRGKGELIEVEPEGVIISPISKYIHLDIRICRPAMLDQAGKDKVAAYMEKMLVQQPKYDITNIEKLLFKYLYTKFRPDTKVYLGGNTRFEKFYICSGMIGHAFHKAGYPVVPSLRFKKRRNSETLKLDNLDDYLRFAKHHNKNYSHVVPSDFDNSPFFATIKFMYLNRYNKGPTQGLQVEDESAKDQ